VGGEDARKSICGVTPNTITARNFIRMIAGGAAAHSDHGRSVAEVFMSAALWKKQVQSDCPNEQMRFSSFPPCSTLILYHHSKSNAKSRCQSSQTRNSL
jgi:hydroxylamine reductase (hybrid-cluster protein)